MKQKTSKKVAWVLAAALCASIALPAATLLAFRGEEAAKSPFQGVYGGSFTAFAAEVELPKVSLSAASADGSDGAEEPAATYSMVTKGMFSVDNDFLLLVTNIDDSKAYSEAGYKIAENDGAEETKGGKDVYTSIIFNANTGNPTEVTKEAIFAEEIAAGNVVDSMIVTEISYDPANFYVIKPYLTANEGDTSEGLVNIGVREVTIDVSMPDGLTAQGTYPVKGVLGDSLQDYVPAGCEGTPADGRTLLGWYDTATGEVIDENTVLSSSAVTIAPYWTRRTGTEVLQQITDDDSANGNALVFNNVQTANVPMNVYDETGAAISDGGETYFNAFSTAYEYVNTTAVGGGEGGYAELGNVLSAKQTIPQGYAFRCGSKVSGGNAVIPVGKTITFLYNFQNFGDSEIHLTLQGVNDGAKVEGPVSNIDLAPGESVRITFQVTYANGSTNKNVMGYFKATQAIENMRLGVSVNVVLAEIGNPAQVSLQLPDGMTVDGYPMSVETGTPLILPQISASEDGKKIAGWYDTETGKSVTADTVVQGDMTIAPYFNVGSDSATKLTAAGVSGSNPDYYGSYNEDLTEFTDIKVEPSPYTKNTDYTANFVNGTLLTSSTQLNALDAFRLKTAATSSMPLDGTTYKIYYVLVNCSEDETVSFDLYQINSGTTINSAAGTLASTAKQVNTDGVVTLAPGESVALEVTVNFNNGGGNLLSMFVMRSTVESLSLQVAMAYEKA